MSLSAIDPDRIRRRLDDLWAIGHTDGGGVTRLAYSHEENAAFDYLRSELPDAYDVRTDSLGNLFATRDPDAPESLYLGSHLDSVYNGGRLDGPLGVVTALEAMEAVHASDETPPRPPTLAVFRAEESARFGHHTIGSRGALGRLTVDEFSATDEEGVPLWLAMQQAGIHPENLAAPTIDLDAVAGFLELHIEQGRVLDEADESIGVVTGIRAPVRYRVTVTGEDDHSGATPMGLRHDALAAAAEAILAVERIGTDAAESGDVVATVGDVMAVEGAINKVCGEVTFPIDLRSNDEAYRDEVESRLLEALADIADRREVEIDPEPIDRSEPVDLDERVVDALADAAAATGVAYRRLPSGGGHDAMNFQLSGVPTGMVFVPSVDGISHSPAEETDPAAIETGTEVLARAILGDEF
ncbi:MAG TPA: Zn-dependent hydrolase [Natrialbaceae archaeon]|nr:Zn-dependent hydrolase [Natrialbaceae archaeon]